MGDQLLLEGTIRGRDDDLPNEVARVTQGAALQQSACEPVAVKVVLSGPDGVVVSVTFV